MIEIAFRVLGRPQPAGSKRAFKHPHTNRILVVDDAKGSRPWKQQVAGAALTAAREQLAPHVSMAGDLELLGGPLAFDVVFVLARPKGHYGTGRNSGQVKDSAPQFPTVKPDSTKLTRAVEDALTGVLWRDDAQVVDQRARKVYGSPERCEVRISTL